MSLSAAPFFSIYWLIVPLIVGLICLYKKLFYRFLALLSLCLLALNPQLVQEEREKIKTTVAILVDDSASNKLEKRGETSETILKTIETRVSDLGFETRILRSRDSRGTLLGETLKNGLSDLPPSRLGGVIAITDGQNHDDIGAVTPFHALITGSKADKDRRLMLEAAPKFGIVGQSIVITFKVIDDGITGARQVPITLKQDNQPAQTQSFETGKSIRLTFPINIAGTNLIELSVPPLEGELTLLNNKLAISVEGVRERLRVLLISGAPHAGERTWRNLLKSDPVIELVHFTILRPQAKASNDNTPSTELSLIPFPTRDLFINKLKEFDLVIFDRFDQINLIPQLYFENIAQYVEEGGALLVSAGPEFANKSSLSLTPLDRVLPARPLSLLEKPFKVALSDLGQKHPVTKRLDLSKAGSWTRHVVVDLLKGSPLLMADKAPLLVLHREQKGRVAHFLSDDIYLWARGYEGGGPHSETLRRLAHWLMKEPDLEEERLYLTARGVDIEINRQTLADIAPPLILISPSQITHELTMSEVEKGLHRAVFKDAELGLWQAKSGDLSRLFMMGPQNPKEWAEVVSTTKNLPNSYRIEDGLPKIIAISGGSNANGSDWIGLKEQSITSLKSLSLSPLLLGFFGLLTLLLILATMWRRESK